VPDFFASRRRSASRRIAVICSSAKRLCLIGSLLKQSHLSRNHSSEETVRVIAALSVR
jgi:hypothetical protein